ncbi:hypothetical protein JOM56_000258 [Amanita muscaria]
MFNPFSSWTTDGLLTTPPSVYGALPYPSHSLSLLFPLFNPSDLNCAAVSAHGQVYYNIVTDAEYTVVKSASGESIIAMIEWKPHPLVEIRGILDKQPVKDWLKLSQEHNSRCMEIRGVKYTWAPRGRALEASISGGMRSGAIVLACITRGDGKLMLDVSPDPIQLGILDSIVTATILLQCGRNID